MPVHSMKARIGDHSSDIFPNFKMGWLLFTTLLFLYSVKINAVPVANILAVDFTCGTTTSDISTLTVTADRDVKIFAVCKDGYKFNLVSEDTVHFRINVSYSGVSSQSCVFRKISAADSYDVDVMIGKQTNPISASVLEFGNRYTVTCKIDPQSTKLSDQETVSTSKLGVKGIYEYKGTSMASSISLKLVDVNGDQLVGSVLVGKVARLKGTFTLAGSETGMKALSCIATNNVATYPVLIGGCGDGTVFSKSTGFETIGTEVFSPYFTTFRLQGGSDLFFKCNFTACTTVGGCDGVSYLGNDT